LSCLFSMIPTTTGQSQKYSRFFLKEKLLGYLQEKFFLEAVISIVSHSNNLRNENQKCANANFNILKELFNMPYSYLQSYIHVEWTQARGTIFCPASGEKITKVPYSTATDLDLAVKVVKKSFPEWRRTPPPCFV